MILRPSRVSAAIHRVSAVLELGDPALELGDPAGSGASNRPDVVIGPGVVVRGVTAHGENRWRELFRAYRRFYELAEPEEIFDRVWQWVNDPTHETLAKACTTNWRPAHTGALATLRPANRAHR